MIGDEVVATGHDDEPRSREGRAVLAMQATVNGKSVLDGEAPDDGTPPRCRARSSSEGEPNPR